MPITPDGGIYTVNHTALAVETFEPAELGLALPREQGHLSLVQTEDIISDLPDHDISGIELTTSEALNLYYASIGLTAPEAAGRLVVEEPTVKTHRASVMRKMGTYTMHGAVAKAITTGKLGIQVNDRDPQSVGLSSAQLELIEIAALDFNYSSVAEMTHKAVPTIRTHAKIIRQKLGAKTIPHAVRLAFENRVISAGSLRDRADELKAQQVA